MTKFIKRIVYFILTCIVLIFFLVSITGYIARQSFDFNISSDKNILILGNSHPEHSINDDIVDNAFNLAQSGSGYFYDYIKLREIAGKNAHIDTIVIGYAYDDLHKNMDSWFDSPNRIKHKFKNFFFLFNLSDYLSLLKVNPKDVLLNTPQVIFQNLLRKTIGYKGLGGYLRTDAHKLEIAKLHKENHQRDIRKGLSKYQSKYLLDIYDFCKKRQIKLILLTPPIHSVLQEIQEPLRLQYCTFAKNNLPEAILVDHSKYQIPDKGFRDLDHLNSLGAEIYSSFLISNKFFPNQETCIHY